MTEQYQKLTLAANKVKQNAYAPYSKFRVGAAILTRNGHIYTGCNVENSSFGLTVCAERIAIFNAIADGARNFKAIVVVSDAADFTPPCGACRQVLIDLAGNIDFVMVNSRNQLKKVKLESLLPLSFTRRNIHKSNNSTQ